MSRPRAGTTMRYSTWIALSLGFVLSVTLPNQAKAQSGPTGPTSFVVRDSSSTISLCSGLIVGLSYGVAPATCVTNLPTSRLRITVGAGTPSQRVVLVSQVTPHPNFNPPPYSTNYDVAVLAFSDPLILDQNVQIGLPSSSPLYSPYQEWIADQFALVNQPPVCP